MIIARIFGWRSAAMNMCSVRHSPMPSAPCSIALTRVGRRVGVGAHAEPADLVRPAEHALEALVAPRLDQRHVVAGDHAGAAVDRDPRAGGDHDVAHADHARAQVDVELAGADDRRAAHPARDERGVRGLAALGGEDAARGVEAGDVVGLGERAHEDHVAAVGGAPRPPPRR